MANFVKESLPGNYGNVTKRPSYICYCHGRHGITDGVALILKNTLVCT